MPGGQLQEKPGIRGIFGEYLGRIGFIGILSVVTVSQVCIGSVYGSENEFLSHVTKEVEGKEGSLFIDAEVDPVPGEVYAGSLIFEDIPLETGKKLYGDPEKWADTDFYQDAEGYEYEGKDHFLLYSQPENHFFSLDTPLARMPVPEAQKLNEEEARRKAEELPEILGINAKVLGLFGEEEDPEGVYSYMYGGTINDTLVAAMSPVWSKGSVEITGNEYSYMFYSCHYVPAEMNKVEVMAFSEILEKAALYAKAGFVRKPASGMPVTRISLQYYVEDRGNGLEYYPVWNFQVPYLLGASPMIMGKETDDLFYIDAQTGMLVKAMS